MDNLPLLCTPRSHENAGPVGDTNPLNIQREHSVVSVLAQLAHVVSDLAAKVNSIPVSTDDALTGARISLQLPKFDGSGDFVAFEIQFRSMASLFRWNEEQSVHMVGLAMDGTALAYYARLPPHIRQEDELLFQTLRRRYCSVIPDASRDELLSRVRKPGERMADLCDHLWRLALEAYPDLTYELQERMALDALKRAVDRELRLRLMDRGVGTLQEAVEVAEQYEWVMGKTTAPTDQLASDDATRLHSVDQQDTVSQFVVSPCQPDSSLCALRSGERLCPSFQEKRAEPPTPRPCPRTTPSRRDASRLSSCPQPCAGHWVSGCPQKSGDLADGVCARDKVAPLIKHVKFRPGMACPVCSSPTRFSTKRELFDHWECFHRRQNGCADDPESFTSEDPAGIYTLSWQAWRPRGKRAGKYRQRHY